MRLSNGKEEQRGKKRKREEEKEENETGTVKRRCEGFVSLEALDSFVKCDLERCVIFLGKTSWTRLRICLIVSRRLGWLVVPEVLEVLDVTDVLVSPSSVVTEFCDGFSCCSDWDFVEPQSFSFSTACSFLYSYVGRDLV